MLFMNERGRHKTPGQELSIYYSQQQAVARVSAFSCMGSQVLFATGSYRVRQVTPAHAL